MGCNGSGNAPGDASGAPGDASGASGAQRTLTVSTTSVVPGEIVVVTDSSAEFQANSYTAQLGGNSVTLARTGKHSLGFQVPALSAGKVSLSVKADGATYAPVALTVGAAPAIPADPATYVSNLVSRADTNLDALRAGTSDPAIMKVVDVAKADLSALSSKASALSPKQQAQLAILIAANPGLFSPSPALFWQSDFDTFLSDTAKVTAIIALGAIAVTGGPVLAAVGPIAAGIATAAMIPRLENDVGTVVSDLPILQTVDGTSESGSPVRTTTTSLSCTSGQSIALTVNGTFRSLYAGDQYSSTPEAAAVASAIAQAAYIPFRLNPYVPQPFPLPAALPTIPTTATQPLNPAFLSIDPASLSPASVTVVQSGQGTGGAFAVSFVDSDCAAATPPSGATSFSFSMTYNDGFTPPTTIQEQGSITCQTCDPNAGDTVCGTSCCGPGQTCDPNTNTCACSVDLVGCGTACCNGSSGQNCVDSSTSTCGCSGGNIICGLNCCDAASQMCQNTAYGKACCYLSGKTTYWPGAGGACTPGSTFQDQDCCSGMGKCASDMYTAICL